MDNGFGVTLLRIDGSGNLLSLRDSRDGSSGRSESAVAIVATPDGGFATLSRVGMNGTFGVVLRKFNSSLVPIFEKWIQRANPVNTNSNQFVGDDLVVETDGGFLISGNTAANEAGSPPAASGGGAEATIMRVSAAGDLEFVSVLGGPKNEGRTQNSGQPSSATFVVRAGDGGYGLTTSTFSYRGEVNPEKSDWWTVKTDAARRVRNFSGIMTDLPLNWFTLTNAANTGSASPAFTRVPGDPTTVTTSPQFIFENLANNVGINLPDVIFQGSSPRIVSNLTAEAVVGQHFAYHILAAYFPAGQTLTYSVTGLPAGFRFNTATGVISGAPRPGSETTTPLLITITATDGVETAQATLRLSIGSGVPQFTVNGSDQPAFPTPAGTPVVGQADKPLVFAAKYPGRRASQVVGVQATTTPNDEASWRRLETGTDGYMTLNVATQRYVLSSTNYPALNGVYFRARVTADGQPEVKSNVVGPFDLGSATPRVGQTLFHIIRNGRRADLDFRVDMISPRTDMAVRVQSTKRPTEEASWSDVATPNAGRMTQDADPKRFSLTTNGLAPDDGLYFRAVATAAGSVSSLSNIIGPYAIFAETPPLVTITSPARSGSNGSSSADPLIINTDANGVARFRIAATATSNNFIKSLKLLIDGSVLETVTAGATQASIEYTISGFGDHIIQALAVDEFDLTGRAGTSPLFIRILPPGGVSVKSNATDATESATTGAVFLVANSGGLWTDPATWNRVSGSGSIPGANDFAIIDSSTVRLDTQQAVGVLAIRDGGRLVGPGRLRIFDYANVFGGSFDSGVHLIVGPGARLEALNANAFSFNGVLENFGKVNIYSEQNISGLTELINQGEIVFQRPVSSVVANPALLPLNPPVLSANLINNLGRISSLIGQDGAGLINPAGGNLIGQDGAGIISGGAGNIISGGAGNIIANDGASLIGQDGAGIISGGAGNIISGGAGNIISGGAGNRPTQGEPDVVNGSAFFVQSGGETDLTRIVLNGDVTLNGGILSGSGLVAGSLTNEAGFLSPGRSPGSITVAGSFAQNANGTLVLEAAGGEAGDFDQVRVAGAATLGGQLVLKTSNGYVPFPGDPFNPLGYASVSGSFSTITSNAQVAINATGILTTLDPNVANPPAPRLRNVSTRMRVETGDNVLIGGFIITGTAPKKVIIRAIGPSLPVPDRLGDTTLELNGPGGMQVFNDNWRTSQEAEIIATTVPPTSDLESAIVATLAPGGYTAIVRGTGTATGVALVEVYDLDDAAPATLANISTRGRVNTGDNVMIGGFIVGGMQPARVLVRAIGPSLPVAGALADPILEVHDRNGNTILNDDWRATQEAEIIATTVPPTNNLESALIATLVPGNYTAVVRGKNEGTGVALVEVFRLQ